MSATTCARSGGAALYAAAADRDLAWPLLEHQRDADRDAWAWRVILIRACKGPVGGLNSPPPDVGRWNGTRGIPEDLREIDQHQADADRQFEDWLRASVRRGQAGSSQAVGRARAELFPYL